MADRERDPGDPNTPADDGWDPQPGTTGSSAPGELAGLVNPTTPAAPVWPAPGSVPPWVDPNAPGAPGSPAPEVMPGSLPPGYAAPAGWAASQAPAAQPPVSADPTAPPDWTSPGGTPPGGTASGGTPPAGWTPPAETPAKKGGIPGWLISGAVIAAIVVGGIIFRDRLSGDAGDLKVGDCFDDPGQTTEVSDVQHHPCTESHDAEVIFVGDHPDQTLYPGDDAFDTFVEQQCIPAFNSYLGRDFDTDTEFGMGFFYPLADRWGDGDHEIACYVQRSDGTPLTNSVKS